MSLGDDVDLDEFVNQKDDLSGADIRAICTEAGLMALRERRMRVQMDDFRAARTDYEDKAGRRSRRGVVSVNALDGCMLPGEGRLVENLVV